MLHRNIYGSGDVEHRFERHGAKRMTSLEGFSDLRVARERVETAFYAPIGMMSPFWLAYGAAASAGAALWWMSRFTTPMNTDAPTASPDAAAKVDAPSPLARDAAPVEAETTLFIVEPIIEPIVEALAQIEPSLADDLTKLTGVGPKLAKALSERGVQSFRQLAAWTDQDLAAFDEALDLRGRAVRADLVAKARRLAAGEP